MENTTASVIRAKEFFNKEVNIEKKFVIFVKLNNIEKFESGFFRVHLFEDEFILFNNYKNNDNEYILFFNYITDKYELFRVKEIMDHLKVLGFDDEDYVFISRNDVIINAEKVIYLNSYNKSRKETIIYRPLFIKIGGLKHYGLNKLKRDEIYKVFGEIINNEERIWGQVKEREVDKEVVIDVVEAFGIRVAKEVLNIVNERDWKEKKEDYVSHIKKFSDLLNLVNTLFVRGLNRKSLTLGNALDRVSQKITDLINTYLSLDLI
jgi:hypothetical protein